MKKYLTILIVLGLLLVWTPQAQAAANAPLPPQSKAFGKTLAEWHKLYWQWYLGFTAEGQVGNVLFMPLPTGTPNDEKPPISVGELNVTLRPGTAFVLPILTWIGETYVENLPNDTPLGEVNFSGATVKVTLDGQTLLDSTTEAIGKYYYGVVTYNPPLIYPEPQPRGENATAKGVIFAQGLGFVHNPLSVGKHTLELYAVSTGLGFGYHNTWHITVDPKAGKVSSAASAEGITGMTLASKVYLPLVSTKQ